MDFQPTLLIQPSCDIQFIKMFFKFIVLTLAVVSTYAQVFPRAGIGFTEREYEITCFKNETYANKPIVYNRYNKDIDVVLLDKNKKPQKDYVLECINDLTNTLTCTVKPQSDCVSGTDLSTEYKIVASLFGDEFMVVPAQVATLKELSSYRFESNDRYGILMVTEDSKRLLGMNNIPVYLETGSPNSEIEATIQYIKPNFEGLDGCFEISEINNSKMSVTYKDSRFCKEYDFSKLNQVSLQLSVMLSSLEFNYLFDIIMITIEVDLQM